MTILVAIDHDSVQDAVVDVAVDLAKGLDQELYVVHLVDREVADSTAMAVRDELRERFAEENVVATVALEHNSHSGARSSSRIGHELVDLATDVDISHVVMGHSTKGLFRQLTEGSTAFSVVAAVDVPVTIVPDGADTVDGAS